MISCKKVDPLPICSSNFPLKEYLSHVPHRAGHHKICYPEDDGEGFRRMPQQSGAKETDLHRARKEGGARKIVEYA